MRRNLRPLQLNTQLRNLPDIEQTGVFRIFNQAGFDTGTQGGCQTASFVGAIEAKYKVKLSYDTMRDLYDSIDKFHLGKGEKIIRVIQYMAVKGHFIPELNRKVYAIDYTSHPPKDLTYKVLSDSLKKFDYVGLGFGKNSPFFSPMTGNLYSAFRLPMGHAVRAVSEENDRIYLQNAWGAEWGKNGLGIIKKSNIDLVKLWELKFVNLKLK